MYLSKKLPGAEWRDPEDLSSTMLRQGVLPELPMAARARRENVPACKTSSSTGDVDERAKGTGTVSGENSLRPHGQGRFVGISPLRARDFLIRQLFRCAPVEMTDGGVPRIGGTLRRICCSDMKDVA